MTTIILKNGDLGSERMRVRCNLSEASAPVEVDYCEGSSWQPTQWQCADCAHRTAGLVAIGRQLAAAAVQVAAEEFDCQWEEID